MFLNTDRSLKKFKICCEEYSYFEYSQKSSGAIATSNGKLYHVSGNLIVQKFELDELFDLEEEDINYSLRDYLSETIMDNLGNTLGQDGIDLLDKKQKEKDKKELMDKQQLKLNFN